MGRYFYRHRKIEEPSDYIRAETLRYTINYVKNSGDLSHESILDNLFCFIPRKQLDRVLDRFVKHIESNPRKMPAPDTSNFKYLYKEALEYFAGNSTVPAVAVILDDVIGICAKELKSTMAHIKGNGDIFASRMEELRQVFKLCEEDAEIFKVVFFIRHNHDFENMCSNAGIHVNGRMDARAAIVNIKLFAGLNEMIVKKALNKESPLRKYGLLEEDLDIAQQLSEFLTGLCSEPLTNKFFRKYSGQPVELDAHINVRQHLDLIEKIINNCGDKDRVNILLYGQPGTGKTEFCRSIGRHLGRDIYEVNTFENDERPYAGTRFRFTALRACQNTVALDKSIIVVDEADEMLNGNNTAGMFFLSPPRNTEKDIINDYLDNNPGVYFWITNHYRAMDDSTRRRFDYSIEFKKFTTQQRVKIWQSCMKKHGISSHFSSEEVANLAKKYEINVGGMEVALKNYKRMTKDMKLETVQKCKTDIIQKILSPHIRLMSGGRKSVSENTAPVSSYSLESLNIKGEIPIVKSLDILKSFSEKVYDADFKGPDEVRNMNVLLYGPPGTGKTEFAKYVALETGRTLLCKKGSDLLSMWVGMTEQNIREAFMEAEAEGAILFIDEADGLFSDRSGAQRTFEVTRVNELLSGMEEFHGILVCATNFKKNMDAASIRRFNLKIEFDYLNSGGKKIFFKRFLGTVSGNELDEKDSALLDKIDNLAPGDFKVVRQKYMFMPEDKVTNMELLEALKLEVDCKNNVRVTSKIGF